LLSSTNLLGQSSDSTRTDSVEATSEQVIAKNDSVLSSQKKKVEVKVVSPWKNRKPAFSESVTNDSLLRWNLYPNWGDYYAYRRDVIAYRQGTIGRVDAFTISGFDQNEQNLWLDDISLNNTVTGLINYNYVPHHKIGSVYEAKGSNLNSYVNIRDYYINAPISYLNFDEAPNGYQNLEFFVAQNTAPGTNIELSYWDRRDGGFYPNNEAKGSQIFGRIYHHLGDNYQIQGMILRNDFNNDESGGYVISDPLAFGFGEFTSTPTSSSGNSEILRTDIKIGIYQRSDTLKPESAGLVFNRIKNDQLVRINSDTLGWELVTYGAKAFKNIKTKLILVEANGKIDITSKKSGTTVGVNNWLSLIGDVQAEFKISENLKLFGNGEFTSRDTKHAGTVFSTGLSIGNSKAINAKITGSLASKIPTIQSLYWQSKNYSGNSNLKNEKSTSIYGELTIPLGKFWRIGASGRLKVSEDAVTYFDSTFTNAESQDMTFGSGYIRFENARFELESSAAYEEFYIAANTGSGSNETLVGIKDSKLWLRNSLFYKTYAFDRATFLKIGVRALLSPLSYQSQFYNTELSYWQQNYLNTTGKLQAYVPAFFRLDAELSARVRAMMIVIRWENALDRFGQAGYFEASSYPMPPRRLMVGIRAQFRN
tara:strand:+ start:5975 stop:7927 length:1953 start_codon:yes stop_codon:yes gene_type:complete